MKRILDISELNPGDKIWTIDSYNGEVIIIEFVCIHPHHNAYSVFLNICGNGMPKFHNARLQDEEYFLYDDSNKCWECIYLAEQTWHMKKVQYLERSIEQKREK